MKMLVVFRSATQLIHSFMWRELDLAEESEIIEKCCRTADDDLFSSSYTRNSLHVERKARS